MRNKSEIIKASLDMYFSGLSFRKTVDEIRFIYSVDVNETTIFRWLQKYSRIVKAYTDTFQADLGEILHSDETVVRINAQEKWVWEAICPKTKMMVASHLSDARTEEDAITIFKQIKAMSKQKPKEICVDGLPAYMSAFRDTFFRRYKDDRVELRRRVGIRGVKKNNPVERLHGTLKDRIKVMRGLKRMERTRGFLMGWNVHYNYIRPHQSLKNHRTPAQEAGIQIDTSQRWGSLIEQATWYETKRR
jgi:transposase-like protein